MTENQNEMLIVRFLQDRGWVVDRINQGVYYRNGLAQYIGKPGQPDWRAKHPRLGYIEVEVKATGKGPVKRQREYMASMRQLGFRNVVCVDSLEAFADWYHYYEREFIEAVAS